MTEVLFTCTNEPYTYCLEIGRYPAGEPMIKDGHAPARVLLRPSTLETFFATLFWVDALAERGYGVPDLILPCVPGARQDRMLERRADQLLTIKSIARELNMRNFPHVTILDPHSHVTSALIDRCQVVPSVEVFRTVQNIWDGIIAPDGGAEKRAEAVARLYGLPLFHAWKVRDIKSGQLNGFGCEPIPSTCKSLLMVDDLCDGGGTFIGLADHLRAAYTGALDLFTTHGYYTKGVDELKKRFTRIITTDSVLTDFGRGIEVFPTSLNLLTGGFA